MMEYYTYLLIFHGNYGEYEKYNPIMKYESLDEIRRNNIGTMHLFDENLVPILPGIEYVLHMPRLELDLCDLHENLIDKFYDEPHRIMLVPDSTFIEFCEKIRDITPALVIYAEDCNDKVKDALKLFNTILGCYEVNQLNRNILKKHWGELSNKLKNNKYEKLLNIDEQYIFEGEYLKALTLLFLARQYNNIGEVLSKIYNSSNLEEKCIEMHWKQNTKQNTLMEIQKRKISDYEKVKKVYRELYKEEAHKFSLNIVITFPGVPKQQIKYAGVSNIFPENEKRAIRIMGIHRAIANNGVLIELPLANENIYKTIDEIEIRCKQGTNNTYIKRLMKKLGKDLGKYLKDYQLGSLLRAKHITIFSDVPIGLAILENTEVPLQCYKSISYRTLSPLTRNFEIEMCKSPQLYLGKGCKVAFAECIINNEDNACVRRMSEIERVMLKNMERDYPNFVLEYAETYSVKEIIKFIAENIDADILYISAHGYYTREKNMAGLMVGNELWMANENNLRVPPIVLLSACHVSPRGSGVVNIADLFVRAGAIAVLGTFIPVNAERNMILMTRLFTYIMDAQKGNKQYKTLADAWTGIVATNAIHELIQSSKKLGNWMRGKNPKGKIRMKEFQLERSRGKLHPMTIYSDTIKIIEEMLKEEGMEGKFRDILYKKDFFPESFFYQFIGYPENIFLYNENFAKNSDKYE